jgi:hypothetical protein
VRILLEEENGQARYSLVIGYFTELPAKDYSEAFAALCRFEQHQTPRFLSTVLGLWAERDPEAAWEATRPLIDMAVKEDHFVDSWGQKIIGPKDRQALQKYPCWIEADNLVSFYAGLEKANIAASEKERLRLEFQKSYGERFGREEFDPASPPNPGAVKTENENLEQPSFARAVEMLTASLESMPELIATAEWLKDHGALVWGLRRWINEDAAAVPAALDMLSDSTLQGVDVLIVKTWALRDAKAALSWFRKDRPEALLRYAGEGLIAFVGPKDRSILLRGGYSKKDKNWNNESLSIAWGEADPKTAFETALHRRGREFYSRCAESCFYAQRVPRHFRRIFEAIRSIPVPLEDEYATALMEEMGDFDVAAASQYGIEWIRQVRASSYRDASLYSDKKRLIRVWTGMEDPFDGCMDDRTYGCLRVWALFDPKGMRRWVGRQREVELKRALLWLVAHPNGEEHPSAQ